MRCYCMTLMNYMIRYRALARNRHHKYGQSRRLDEHKQSFERLQSDLEFYTEMLSGNIIIFSPR